MKLKITGNYWYDQNEPEVERGGAETLQIDNMH